MKTILRIHYLLVTVCFIVAIYVLCAIQHYQIYSEQWITWIVQSQMLTNSESSFFEILSAIAWLVSFLLFSYALVLSIANSKHHMRSVWIVFYCILSLFSFGEEISWGDHLFDYSHDLAIVKINAQKEFNFHNINVAELLQLPEHNYVHKLTSNIGYLLNPLFYVILVFLWGFLPIAKRLDKNNRWRVLVDMPAPSNAFSIFLIIHSIIFIAIDSMLFNVGQVYEMFISLAAVIVALDILKTYYMDHTPP